MASIYTAKHEDIAGTDLTGVDGAINRTYTLAHANAVIPGMQVSVDGIWYQYGFHYTFASDLITFLVPMYDSSVITLDYNVAGTTVPIFGIYYTTPELVQAELRTSSAFSSTTLPTIDQVNNWIDEESRTIDLLTNQVYSSVITSSIYVDYDGEGILRFPHVPLISITKVEYNINSVGASPSWIELEEGFDKDFIAYLDLGEIEFIHGINSTVKHTPRAGNKKFRLSYVHGYSSVPTDIQKLATLMVTKRVLNTLAANQANTEGGGIQIGTIQIADPTNYSINYITNLDNSIKDYMSRIGRGFKTYRSTRVY